MDFFNKISCYSKKHLNFDRSDYKAKIYNEHFKKCTLDISKSSTDETKKLSYHTSLNASQLNVALNKIDITIDFTLCARDFHSTKIKYRVDIIHIGNFKLYETDISHIHNRKKINILCFQELYEILRKKIIIITLKSGFEAFCIDEFNF